MNCQWKSLMAACFTRNLILHARNSYLSPLCDWLMGTYNEPMKRLRLKCLSAMQTQKQSLFVSRLQNIVKKKKKTEKRSPVYFMLSTSRQSICHLYFRMCCISCPLKVFKVYPKIKLTKESPICSDKNTTHSLSKL